ncbi:MAG: flagellar hook-associated protein FlgL [Lachnospiraceae bacterium]|nr:flagellar hook-associated protein FlgL [Lachnospiraceae bacterium]
MRITNKMMSGNSLSNINTNKEYLDKLNNQMATEKKITRPSDDPIIAIRALRLRSNLSELTQYYGANVPDAKAWVDVTQSAISSTKEILSSLKSYADQGANGTNTASDRQKIYENMNALKTQVYSNGNVTNAGRSVFTGYRTGQRLTFANDTEAYYRDIKDTFNAADVVKASYTEGEIKMDEINKLETTAYSTDDVTQEQAIMENEVYRIRLSYDDVETDTDTTTLTYRKNLNGTQNPSLSIPSGGKDPVTGVINKIVLTDETGTKMTLSCEDGFTHQNSPITVDDGIVTVHNDGTLTFMTPDGTSDGRKVYNISADGRTITSKYSETDVKVEVLNSTDAITDGSDTYEDVYAYMKLNEAGASAVDGNKGKIYMLKDTGELIMGSDIATTLSELPAVAGVDTISVKYNKTRFSEGDVQPQHYFDCINYEDGTKYENKSDDNILYDSHEQSIYYTVGTNQSVQINTYAEDVFDTQIMREIDDVLAAIDGYNNAEAKVNKLKELSEKRSGKDEKVEELLKAANKELDLAKNKLQWTYEDAITQFGNFFNQANQAETACGTVENRLNLISNRLSEEKTTVTTLASENENVDITNVAVEVSEANLVYNAALMATGRISQQTLVDYI